MIIRFVNQLAPGSARALFLLVILGIALGSHSVSSEVIKDSSFVTPPVTEPLTPSVVKRYNAALDRIARQNRSIWNQIGAEHWIKFDENDPRVSAQRKRYLDHRYYVTTVSQRAEPFLYHIVRQLHENGLPLELAMLPFIESAYKVDAVSKHGATGLWQFISSTGKTYGLHTNWWYEGRRDLLASTEAAVRYLKRLNQTFNGDWLLTLAAYNAGTTTVKKAISRNKKLGRPTDFFSLRLPEETMDYVPRFLAVLSLVRAPSTYHVEFWPVQNADYFAEISIEGNTPLKKIATEQFVSLETLKQLNSGYLRAKTPPKGTYTVLLPLQQTEFSAADNSPYTTVVSEQRHQVKSGDTLSRISRHYGVSVAALKLSNALTTDQIQAGQHLVIPDS